LSEGITFKPITGNAVYWENMRADGSGYLESWHAGLPVKSGVKIGLNIWSWLQVGYEPHVDEIAKQKP
jgi:prolyl 4-hydroxylase